MGKDFLASDFSPQDWLAQTTEIARIAVEAGRAIMEVYERPETWNVAVKHDDSPVTQADLRANAMIVAALARLTPEIPVLSEESPWTGADAATYWAVDPLDGTREFLNRNGEFTVNIALVVKGVAQLGVILAPVFKTLWAGLCGDGISRSQTPWAARMQLSVLDPHAVVPSSWQTLSASTSPVPLSVHAHGVAHITQSAQSALPLRLVASRVRANADYPAWLTPLILGATVSAMGSSMKFCVMAQGDADLYVRMGPTCIWDTAAGHAILAAVGGHIVHAQTRAVLTYPDPRQVRNPDFVAFGPRATAASVISLSSR